MSQASAKVVKAGSPEAAELNGQTVLLLGYGAIGRRLAELLAPLRMTVYAVRRQTRSEAGVRIIPESDLTRVLPLADHVVNILPDNAETRNYVNARRLACFKPGAKFYNVGRGTTVGHQMNREMLRLRPDVNAVIHLHHDETIAFFAAGFEELKITGLTFRHTVYVCCNNRLIAFGICVSSLATHALCLATTTSSDMATALPLFCFTWLMCFTLLYLTTTC